MIALPVPAFAAEIVSDVAKDPAAMMQVGPNPSPGQPSALPIPRRRTIIEVPAAAPGAQPAVLAPDRLATCRSAARKDPAVGVAFARAWVAEGKSPLARVRANQCLGMVLSMQGDFAEAEAAFAAAVAGIPPAQAVGSVPLLAMAGNAALAGGQAERAADWFDKALAVPGYADNAALGGIQADRARALVAAGRMAEAGGALDEAHRLAPNDPEGWLLSATLARRNKNLPRAQRDIEVAGNLDPRDPAIGLEAGVIAVLQGREDAARKSWESVVATAPDSEEARTAKGYLEQLGPLPASAPPSPSAPERKQP